MAFGYYFHPESMSAEQYDRVIQKLDEAGAGSPPGRSYHCSFQVGDGVHVFDVWDSEEQFNEFRDSTLIPALQEGGFSDRVAPSISTQPVYNLLTA